MTTPRLIPVWWTACVLTVLAVATLGFALLGTFSDGPQRWAGWLSSLASGLVLVAAAVAFAAPRRRRALQPGPDGSVTIDSPSVIAGALVAAWATLLVVAGLWVAVAVTDLDRIESPGFTLVMVLAAAASLPDLGRLLTGRLHRWRLVLGPDGLSYRGYRTEVVLPWSKVHGARVQHRGPAGVLIDRKGTAPDPVVPITAFLLPADQIVEEIEQRLAVRRR